MRRVFLLCLAVVSAALMLSGCGQQGAAPAAATAVAPPATASPPPLQIPTSAPPATAASPSPTPKPTAAQAQEKAAVVATPGVPQAVKIDFFLELESPASLDVVVRESPIIIQGRTRLDALVTVNDHVLEPDIQGRFRQAVDLTPGLNIIEIVASAASGEQEALVLGVGFIPR